MQELLRQVTRSTQVTTLHITHNEDEAIALADRRFHLEDGQLTRR